MTHDAIAGHEPHATSRRGAFFLAHAQRRLTTEALAESIEIQTREAAS